MLEDEVFSNSPQATGIGTNSVSATPTNENQALLRHKKLADDRKNRLIEAQSDLEIAVHQNDTLSQENAKLRHDVDRLKHQLQDMEKNLYPYPDHDAEPEDEVAELRAHNRQLRCVVSEQRDNEKYLKDVEQRLDSALDENRRLASRQTCLEEKLKGISREKNDILLELEEMKGSLLNAENKNITLLETVHEQQKEIEQLRCIAMSSKQKKSFGRFSTPTIAGCSIADISVDDLQFSPCKEVGGGEVIGNNLILDLREELSKMSEELEKEKDLLKLETEKNNCLAEKVSALESEKESQKIKIEEMSKLKAEEIETLTSQLHKDQEEKQSLFSKISQLEADGERLFYQLAEKDREIETVSFELKNVHVRYNLDLERSKSLSDNVSKLELELKEVKISSLAETERLAVEITRERGLFNLEVERNLSLVEKVSTLESQIRWQETTLKEQSDLLKAQTDSFEKITSECRGQLEVLECELARSREGESALKEKILNLERDVKSLTLALESKTRQLDDLMLKSMDERQKLDLDLKNLEESKKKEVDEARSTLSSKINLLEKDNRQKSLEIEQLAAAVEKSSEEEFASRCQEIREECLKESEQKCEEIRRICKTEEEDALQEQKARYSARVKEITEKVAKQYKEKMVDCISKWDDDIATKKGQIEDLKKKLESSEKAKNEQQKELSIVSRKYELAKQKMSEIVEQNDSNEKALTQDRDQLETKYANAKKVILTLENQIASQKLVVEQQRKELAQIKPETVANFEEFKHPGIVLRHTPGRAKASRTQSEASMSRRPPSGVGLLFAADDETGECFSSTNLLDLKDGRCLVGDSNSRISELSRRNTMYPQHLKSSYPVETQFHAVEEFTDDDLRQGKIMTSPGRSLSETTLSRQSISRRQSLATLNVDRTNVKTSVGDVKRKNLTPKASPRVNKRSRKAEESPASSRRNLQSQSSPNLSFETPSVLVSSDNITPSSKKSSASFASKTPSSLRKLLSRMKSKGKEESPVTSFAGSPRKKFRGLRK